MKRRTLLDKTVLVLLAEKTLQHLFVSLAFYFNWQEIVSTVVVDPAVLLYLGLAAMLLFGLAFFGMWRMKAWAPWLAAGLATFDIIGEFVAQGKMAISITVSFLIACLLLFLSIAVIQRQRSALP